MGKSGSGMEKNGFRIDKTACDNGLSGPPDTPPPHVTVGDVLGAPDGNSLGMLAQQPL
jgi:hypothetical protein